MSTESMGVPVVLDTDIGGDADDALAVAAAARLLPDLAAVVTGDELDGQRARFARHLLDLLDRPDVVTVAGADLGHVRDFVVEDLVPDDVPAQRVDVVDVLLEVCARADGPVRWVGMGPLTNLARIVTEVPVVAARLQVTQMGGALRYRHPDRAEHNVHQDVAATATVFAAAADGRLPRPSFVASEVTWDPRIAVTRESPIYQGLAADDAPAWARLLVQSLDRWFERFHPATLQHDALTLTAALGLPFVSFDMLPIRLDDVGRTSVDETSGAPMRWSLRAEHEPFMNWLAAALALASSTARSTAGHRPVDRRAEGCCQNSSSPAI
ncbi:nucleoside hydrolase [Promicromonospora sp. NFX87]|uniref:nucleoside hydrolase n=1 Tax=Promicromonospora sp. NFX87 TaxID=3402691 RepID=UPI003AFB58CE